METTSAVRATTTWGKRVRRLFVGGTEGNERLTAMTGVVLLGLLAAEGVTILAIRPLLSVHVFIGLMLIPPVALKLGVTGYRFVRYYMNAAEYVRRGPPILLMRMLVAPVLVAATAVVFGTGIALIVQGPHGGIVLGLHKASFVIWLGAFALHVVAYIFRIPALVGADWGRSTSRPGVSLRYGVVALALVLGLTLAVAALPAANGWFNSAFVHERHDH
jgi:hypothetical protein